MQDKINLGDTIYDLWDYKLISYNDAPFSLALQSYEDILGIDISTPRTRIRQGVIDYLFAQQSVCIKCGIEHKLTIDHIIPLAKGGTNDISNLQILCAWCNGVKGTMDNEEFMLL